MSDKTDCCGKCRWGEFDVGCGWGECHRHPPEVKQIHGILFDDEFTTKFPRVHKTDFCGEFVLKG